LLIELVWPQLIADKAHLLHRLLDRLLHVGPSPPYISRSLVSPEDADQSESWFRIPMPRGDCERLLFWRGPPGGL
jgi:hypothetical protein